MLSNLQNPPVLRKGDTIAVVAPSSGLAGLFPHRLEQGIKMLESMGFTVLVSEHAREIDGWVSASPQDRVADLHAAFQNPDVKAIICTIGGNHANQLLKYLDFDLIRKNPKIFMGYSDITVLHYAIAVEARLRTFYGPCVVSEFAEQPKLLPYTREYFEKAVLSTTPIGEVTASAEWTDEFLDWFEKKDLERPRKMCSSEGYEWWREGDASGPIWGGTIPSINHLAGTKYWVDPAGTIFFLDLPEGNPGQAMPQSEVDSFLADLDNLGVFAAIKGLVIGRPYGYDDEQVATLKRMIEYYTQDYEYPVLYNANIGHASPITTVPLGVQVRLDTATNEFSLLEAGVL